MPQVKLSQLLAALALMVCGQTLAETTLDSTAAVVNNDIILTSELDQEQQLVSRAFAARGQSVSGVNARKAAMERLITKNLVLQIARNQGVNPTDSQIDEALQQTALRRNTTPEAILNSMGAGLSEAQARAEFRDELLMNEVRRSRVSRRVNVSDTEVDLLAKNLRNVGTVEPRYHLAQIVLPLSASASPNQVQHAVNTVDSIKAQLRQGASFTELAARYTTGSLAAQGGDLGYLPESQVPVPFLPALLKAKTGDVVGPFRSNFGLHLLKLLDVSHSAVQSIRLYDASHILLTTSIVFSDEAARQELSQLRSQIIAGNISFASAAQKYSEDPGSAIQGGSLGYATPERYDPAFARAMVSLSPGQISEPIQSSFGWHLILLKDIKIDSDSEEAYKDRARDLIYRRLFAEETIAWERELRESAYIHISDPELLNANLGDEDN